MGQDTIENVSQPIENLKCFLKILYVFDTSKCATFIRNIFEVYGGFIGQRVLTKFSEQKLRIFSKVKISKNYFDKK